MGKFIKTETYNELIQARDNWNSIATHIAESSDGISPESVTTQMVIDALGNDTEELLEAQGKIKELETQVQNLRNSAGHDGAHIIADGDGKETDDLGSFLEKNKGNNETIINRLRSEGLI